MFPLTHPCYCTVLAFVSPKSSSESIPANIINGQKKIREHLKHQISSGQSQTALEPLCAPSNGHNNRNT